jgi:hypothetical protein
VIEVNIALVGHTDPSVNDKYGAKDKAIRFRHRLAEAIASVAYAGLDLSHLGKPCRASRPCTIHAWRHMVQYQVALPDVI